MLIVTSSTPSQGTILWTDCHDSVVKTIAWSPDSTRIAFGGGKTISVLEVLSQKRVVAYQEHPIVFTLSWSSNGKQIVSGGDDDKIHIWDAASGTMLVTYRGYTRCVAWSPDGTCIAAGSKIGNKAELRVYDVITGKYASIGRWNSNWFAGWLMDVAAIDWAPDGASIASCDWSNTIQIRDAKNGNILVECTCPAKSKTVKWSPDSKRIASIHFDNTIRIWDVDAGTTLNIFDKHTTFPQALAWSPDGTQVVSGDHRDVLIWDVGTGDKLFWSICSNGVSALAWAPDGKYIASGSFDGEVKVWQAN
ncbi:MAG TPA: WD40 repeat domain-containing protein [Ktedonobacteraceae bacterium]|nr:WD40 repeat domain-containing protein [Ktedonobacteraceae bacterium]